MGSKGFSLLFSCALGREVVDVVDDAAVVAGGLGVLSEGAVGSEVEVAFEGYGRAGDGGGGQEIADSYADADAIEFVEGRAVYFGGEKAQDSGAEGGIVVLVALE